MPMAVVKLNLDLERVEGSMSADDRIARPPTEERSNQSRRMIVVRVSLCRCRGGGARNDGLGISHFRRFTEG